MYTLGEYMDVGIGTTLKAYWLGAMFMAGFTLGFLVGTFFYLLA